MIKLIVDTPSFPPLTINAIQYSWSQIKSRINIKDTLLDLVIYYGHDVSKHRQPDTLLVWIKPCAKKTFDDIIHLKENSLNWLSLEQVFHDNHNTPFEQKFPVLFWSTGAESGNKPILEITSNFIILNVDIIATTFFMLSRWEEIVIKTRDAHGRFPAKASTAYKQGFLNRPIVDEYALFFQECLKILCPGWDPPPRKFEIRISHDIDSIKRFSNIFYMLLTAGGDIIKRFNLKLAIETLFTGSGGFISFKKDQYIKNIKWLAELSLANGISSSFNIMTAGNSKYDAGYDIAQAKDIIHNLQSLGFEIGFHPGYYTFGNLKLFTLEKNRMDMTLGRSDYGGRQHYLRFEAPMTWRFWEKAGLAYDSTLGYAEQEGFRCGTCHPFKPYDVLEQRVLNITEVPLIVSDRTLEAYRELSCIESQKAILELAKRCVDVGGIFTMLWHNTSYCGDYNPYGQMYSNLLPMLRNLR